MDKYAYGWRYHVDKGVNSSHKEEEECPECGAKGNAHYNSCAKYQ